MRIHQRVNLLPFGRAALLFAVAALCAAGAVRAQTAPAAGVKSAPRAGAQAGTPEQRTARTLEAARANPLALRAFLVDMPKGADLHNHLGGAIYAESWIRAAVEDRNCIDLSTMSIVRGRSPGDGGDANAAGARCAGGNVPASRALTDSHLYDQLVDAFSMRSFVPSTGTSGHDHFFDSFAKFAVESDPHSGEWLDEIATRAAAQNEQYAELMITPPFPKTIELAKQFGWRRPEPIFGEFREFLLSHGLKDDVAATRAFVDQAEQARNKREHCGEQKPAAACAVQIRYLYQVLRAEPREQVFAQTVLGFEMAAADPRFVGINYVQPEDASIAMADYNLHMKMVEFLHQVYPQVHISLHAGELAPGLVPPDGLCCHIRLAVEQAHAERIGHGVDLMYEEHPYDLLREMAGKHVMVEINLTSNDVILGVAGKDHPLPLYRKYGVPVALSTDDEGVSRIDITHEYERAVQDFGLKYADLKQMARTGIAHSFLSGAELWKEQDHFDRVAPPCASEVLGAESPSAACARFLQQSEKAQQEWELERRFRAFESAH